MKRVPLEKLELQPMASGGTALLLTQQVAWKDFPQYVRDISILLCVPPAEPIRSVDVQIATLEIDGQRFWLAWDEWFDGVALEPQSDLAAALIADLRERLQLLRAAPRPA